MQPQSDIRTLLIQIELALEEGRYEDANVMLGSIDMESLKALSHEEIVAVGRVLNHLKETAEKKRDELIGKMKEIQAGKKYAE
ncbi:hypothetical protein [Thermodesulfovibrio hydrogeniphilus]